MEHGFLKAPWEVLLRNFRAGHKPVAKEVETFSTAVSQLIQHTQPAPDSGEQNTHILNQDKIDMLEQKLTGLKRKLEAVRSNDEHGMRRCYYRLKHLQTKAPLLTDMFTDNTRLSDAEDMDLDSDSTTEPADTEKKQNGESTQLPPDSPPVTTMPVEDDQTCVDSTLRWEKLRLDRALVDYMLREGMYETAEALAKSHSIEHIVDMDIFRESRVVIEALRRRDCTEGLRWCAENKRRLQKVQSKLEFRLRLQEFVEHARAERKIEALAYMMKHISSGSGDEDRFADIQRFMGLLVFEPTTNCQPYKDLYSESKWLELENAFKQDNYLLHGLTRESTIEIMLKSGLASLKTRKCGTEADKKTNCPTCVEPYLTLAQELPRGRHENSVLVCSISGRIMDENNPPMAFPNGNVYSLEALTKIADANDGTVIDPRNQDKVSLDKLRKCYIM